MFKIPFPLATLTVHSKGVVKNATGSHDSKMAPRYDISKAKHIKPNNNENVLREFE